MSKSIRYMIPGIHGELEVRLISRKAIRKHVKNPSKGDIYNGLYDAADYIIYIAKELHGSARVSVLTHEIGHALLEACAPLGEEEQCDLIGAYYHRLYADPSFLGCVEEIGRA